MKKCSLGKYILIGISIVLIIILGEKKVPNIIILFLFLDIIIKELKYIKELIIPTRETYVEIIPVLLSIIILIWIIYCYAKTWINYITGVLGTFMLISTWIKVGIGSKGFISMYRYKEIILWNEIEKVIVIGSNDIKIKVSGGFMQQTFHFKKSDYDKVLTFLKENLHIKTQLQTIFNE